MINTIILAFVLFTATIMSDCPTGQVLCGGTCTQLNTDPFNCGSCGYICDNDATCSNGRCDCQNGQGNDQGCPNGHHVGQNCSCCLNPCNGQGSPFWGMALQPGGCPGFFTTDLTAKTCCLSCFADPNCVQWAFAAQSHFAPGTCTNPGGCCEQDIFVQNLTMFNLTAQAHCTFPIVSVVGLGDGGGRCLSEVTPCYPKNDPIFPPETSDLRCALRPSPPPGRNGDNGDTQGNNNDQGFMDNSQ